MLGNPEADATQAAAFKLAAQTPHVVNFSDIRVEVSDLDITFSLH